MSFKEPEFLTQYGVCTDLLSAVRYIHQNPLEAGATKSIKGYRWSSYHDYISKHPALADTEFVLHMMSADPIRALQEFEAFHKERETRDCSLPDTRRPSEDEVRREILAALNGREPNALVGLPKVERDAVLASLRRQGFSIRQIERTTGVSRRIVEKAWSNRSTS